MIAQREGGGGKFESQFFQNYIVIQISPDVIFSKLGLKYSYQSFAFCNDIARVFFELDIAKKDYKFKENGTGSQFHS